MEKKRKNREERLGGKRKMQHVWYKTICKSKYLYELLRAMNGKSLQNIDDACFRVGGESCVFYFFNFSVRFHIFKFLSNEHVMFTWTGKAYFSYELLDTCYMPGITLGTGYNWWGRDGHGSKNMRISFYAA